MEWELLVEAEDIKIGNLIVVESEDGSTESMKLMKQGKVIVLRDEFGELKRFDPESLEELGGTTVIVGKNE
jgi:hypothetical protein